MFAGSFQIEILIFMDYSLHENVSRQPVQKG